MNRDILKQIIVDQKEMYLGNPLISRDYDLEENVIELAILFHDSGYLQTEKKEHGIRDRKSVV